MGLFGSEAPKPPEPKGLLSMLKSPAESFTASLTQKIASYGTAVTVGVFIGAALTTGIACGVAGWWVTHKFELVTFLKRTTMTAAGLAKSAAEDSGLIDMAKSVVQGASGKKNEGVDGGGGVKSSFSNASGGVSEGSASLSDQEILRATVKQLEALQERVAVLEKAKI